MAATKTTKKFEITETKITESGFPDKYVSELVEAPAPSTHINDATSETVVQRVNDILDVLEAHGLVAKS